MLREARIVMDEKVQVRVCVGTACHIMGAADLIVIEDLLDPAVRDRVEVVGVTCMDLCKDEAHGKPPFVVIDGETLSEATLDKVLGRIDQRARRLIDGDAGDVGS